jgi:hypothetical protein
LGHALKKSSLKVLTISFDYLLDFHFITEIQKEGRLFLYGILAMPKDDFSDMALHFQLNIFNQHKI